MPLTPKGEEIMSAMQKQYGAEKGKSVFYASKNAGKISGVDEAVGADFPAADCDTHEPPKPAGAAGPERPERETFDYKEVASLDSLKKRAGG